MPDWFILCFVAVMTVRVMTLVLVFFDTHLSDITEVAFTDLAPV